MPATSLFAIFPFIQGRVRPARPQAVRRNGCAQWFGARQHHGEFFAARPAGEVFLPETGGQTGREPRQDFAATGVAMHVVHTFDVIDTVPQRGQWFNALAGARDFALSKPGESPPVERPGERIGHRQVKDIPLVMLRLDEVAGRIARSGSVRRCPG